MDLRGTIVLRIGIVDGLYKFNPGEAPAFVTTMVRVNLISLIVSEKQKKLYLVNPIPPANI